MNLRLLLIAWRSGEAPDWSGSVAVEGVCELLDGGSAVGVPNTSDSDSSSVAICDSVKVLLLLIMKEVIDG